VKTGHPSWCIGAEPDDADHVSATVSAAGPTDVIDIRLRVSQPADVTADETSLTTLELEFVEDDQLSLFVMEIDQVQALVAAVTKLLPTPPDDLPSLGSAAEGALVWSGQSVATSELGA
jgi:hypothetical protein